jgi:hypothetical protein
MKHIPARPPAHLPDHEHAILSLPATLKRLLRRVEAAVPNA